MLKTFPKIIVKQTLRVLGSIFSLKSVFGQKKKN